METVTIRVEDVHPQNNHRRSFDDDYIEGLAASLAEVGQINPITVRERPAGGYWLITGECRWRAHLRLGWEEIAATVTDDDDRTAKARMLAENAARNDLSALDEAEAYREQVEDYGDDVETVAMMAGRSVAYVEGRMALLSLVPEVQEALRSRSFAVGYGDAMVGLDAERQRAALSMLGRTELTVVEFMELTERMRMDQAEISMFDAEAFAMVADDWVQEAQAANAHLHPKQMAVLFDRVLEGVRRSEVEVDDDLGALMARAQRAIDFRLKKGEFAPQPRE